LFRQISRIAERSAGESTGMEASVRPRSEIAAPSVENCTYAVSGVPSAKAWPDGRGDQPRSSAADSDAGASNMP
jgi:hypothetical protein